MREAISSLENLRQARIELANGLLHVALSDEPSSPFERVEGMALLRQAMSALEESVRTIENGSGGPLVLQPEGATTAFRNSLSSFQARLKEWSRPGDREPGLETDLRETFYELERQAAILDGHILRSLNQQSARLDLAFRYTLAAAVILFSGICLTVFFLGRAQKESADALLFSEKRLRILVETIPDLVWLKDPDGVYLACNRRFEGFFGAKQAEIVGKTDYDFVDTELADFFRENDRKAMAAGRPTINEEWVAYADDGHRELLETIKTPMRGHDGRLIGVLGIARDITGLRAVQEALGEREEIYSAIVNQAADSIVLIDVETQSFAEFNDTACNNLGYSRDEFAALRFPEITVVEDPEATAEYWPEILDTGSASYETHFRRKNGEIRDVWVSARPVTIRGRRFLAAVCRDVTERKRAEKSLRYHERLLREMGKVAKIGGWEFEPATGKGSWTEEVARIHDLDPNDETSVERGMSFFHGEYRSKIEKAFKEAIELGQPYDLELEMISAKGDHKWVQTIGRPKVKNGKVVQVRGSFQDITERKRAEQRIEHLNRVLRSIREVNELIVREKDPDRLIQVACKLLVENQGYASVLIIATDEADVPRSFAEAGTGDALLPLAEKLNQGELPPCCKDARFHEGVYLVADRQRVCGLCPVAGTCPTGRSMCIRLRHEEKNYGYLAAAGPHDSSFDEEELSLFAELAGDIAFALRNIELAEQATLSAESLHRSEERYRSLVESISDVIYEIDSEGMISYVSPVIRNVLGYEPEEIMGKNFVALVRPEDRGLVTERFGELMEGVEHPAEYRMMGKSGEIRWVRTLTKPAMRGRSFTGARGTLIDITERKRAEEALQKRVIALTQPLDEPAAIQLSDLFDIEELQRIQDAFAEATGVASIITMPDGTPITRPSNFCRLCNEIIRRTEKGLANCFKSDAAIGRYNPSGPIVQTCLSGGLWDAGASITIGGKHIANWLVGQVRNEDLDEDRMLQYAYEIGADPEDFAKALADVPIMSKEQFEKVSRALFCFANELSMKAYQNVQQARFIADRQNAEALRMRLVTAIEQAAEGVAITDARGTIQYVNPAYEKITGYDSKELVGQTPAVLKSGEHDQAFYQRLWETITRGEVWAGRLVNKRKDGRLYHEDATISPVRDSSGKIVNLVAVTRDITENLELSRQLQQAQKMEAVGTLAGGVAHDFNNILQVALGYSDLMLGDEELPQHYRTDLKKINESAKRGADLVKRLLTFSRKTEMKPQPLNLNRRISELRKMLERTIPRMINIKLLLGENLATINADPTQTDQVLMNLAVNARDAMPDGGTLIFETADIVLDEEYARTHLDTRPGRYVLLMVTDTGSGMDKDTLEHIFEPFYTTKGVGEGTGLGLAMVHGIVKHHGGYIRCYSEPGEGTTFKIWFPALISDDDKEETTVRAIPRGGSETILVVDDEEAIRDLGSRILTRAGYKVITASNGKEALEVYQARSEEIALVILDLIMPEIGGRQCLEALLKLNSSIKVVIASGYSAHGPTKDALAAGAKGFVNKPYGSRQVLDVVREVLDAN